MAASQPGFLEAYREGSAEARDANHGDGKGGSTHPAVNHWIRLLVFGLKMDPLRPVEPHSPLQTLLAEVDVVECYAWWLITQVGVNHETAKGYVSTVNAWHRRRTHIDLAGGFPLKRVNECCDGLARLKGVAPPRLKRIGVRPRLLRAGIDIMFPTVTASSLNRAAALETIMATVRRAGEVAVGGKWKWDAQRHPTRNDVTFQYDNQGNVVYATVHCVNSKARGVEAKRKLPFRVPRSGKFLNPGYLLYLLTEVVDPVPPEERAFTPLFRVPETNAALTVRGIRSDVRKAMEAVGLDGSAYGAHSLRIGAATALDDGGAPEKVIKAIGVWSSEAYLRYIRETSGQALRYVSVICNSEVEDLDTNDYLGVDDVELNDDDFD